MKKYTYSVYDLREEPNKHIKDVSERTIATAVVVAGFGNIVSAGGRIEEQANGSDGENTRILIYQPETVASGSSKPDFIMERLF